MKKVRAVISRFRAYVARPDVRRWVIPYRKPLLAVVAAGLVALGSDLGVLDWLPAGWSEVGAALIVGYFVPEREPTTLARADALVDALVSADAARREGSIFVHDRPPPVFGTPPDVTPDVATDDRALPDEQNPVGPV